MGYFQPGKKAIIHQISTGSLSEDGHTFSLKKECFWGKLSVVIGLCPYPPIVRKWTKMDGDRGKCLFSAHPLSSSLSSHSPHLPLRCTLAQRQWRGFCFCAELSMPILVATFLYRKLLGRPWHTEKGHCAFGGSFVFYVGEKRKRRRWWKQVKR